MKEVSFYWDVDNAKYVIFEKKDISKWLLQNVDLSADKQEYFEKLISNESFHVMVDAFNEEFENKYVFIKNFTTLPSIDEPYLIMHNTETEQGIFVDAISDKNKLSEIVREKIIEEWNIYPPHDDIEYVINNFDELDQMEKVLEDTYEGYTIYIESSYDIFQSK